MMHAAGHEISRARLRAWERVSIGVSTSMKPFYPSFAIPELFCGAAPDWRAAWDGVNRDNENADESLRGVDVSLQSGTAGFWRYSECVAWSVHFDSRSQFGIGFWPLHNVAFDCDHEFAARLFPLGVGFGLRLFVKTLGQFRCGRAHRGNSKLPRFAPARYPTRTVAGLPASMREAST